MPFLSLGRIPLSSVLSSHQLAIPEERRSLEVAFCKRCNLVQLIGEVMSNSSMVPAAEGLLEEHWLGPQAVVLALEGSNPAQLRVFARAGAKVIYLEPHPERSQAVSGKNIHVRSEHFNSSYARALLHEGIRADVILANQLPSYSSHLNQLFKSLVALLNDEGVLITELAYLGELLEARQFQFFSHQQLHYFSAHAVYQLARRHDLQLQEVEPLSAGYLRYYLRKARQNEAPACQFLEAERALGLTSATYYIELAAHIAAMREALVTLIAELHARGRRVAAFGVSYSSMTLLNYAGLGREAIDFVVDVDESRHGRYLAGVHIPVYGPQKLLEEQPDYLLLLGHPPEEVASQHQVYLQAGGKLITAVPYPKILKASSRRSSYG